MSYLKSLLRFLLLFRKSDCGPYCGPYCGSYGGFRKSNVGSIVCLTVGSEALQWLEISYCGSFCGFKKSTVVAESLLWSRKPTLVPTKGPTVAFESLLWS